MKLYFVFLLVSVGFLCLNLRLLQRSNPFQKSIDDNDPSSLIRKEKSLYATTNKKGNNTTNRKEDAAFSEESSILDSDNKEQESSPTTAKVLSGAMTPPPITAVVVSATTIASKARAHNHDANNNGASRFFFAAGEDRLLLRVPFYVYDNVGLPDELTYNGTGFDPAEIELFRGKPPGFVYKNTDDVLLARAALEHPMRTTNPSEAKLFFVAAPLNAMAMCRKGNISLCYKEHCGLRIVDHVDRTLANSSWYQRHGGRDHVIVTSHIQHRRRDMDPIVVTGDHRMRKQGRRWPHIGSINRIGFEDSTAYDAKDRFSFPSYYVGHGCPAAEETRNSNKALDFVMIGSLKEKFRERRMLCGILNESPQYKSVCGEGVPQCPSLGGARFGFHVRGDTHGANRLMDTVLSDAVPVFTDAEQYKILPGWIDWEQLSYFVSIENTTEFRDSLGAFLEDTEAYRAKLDALRRNRDLFDYNTLIPFDTYMHGFLVKVWPELGPWSNDASPSPHFSALKIPTPKRS